MHGLENSHNQATAAFTSAFTGTVMHKPTVTVTVEFGGGASTSRSVQLQVVTAAPTTVGYLRRKLAAELQIPIKELTFTHAAAASSSGSASASASASARASARGRTWTSKTDRTLLSDGVLRVDEGSVVTVTLRATKTCIIS